MNSDPHEKLSKFISFVLRHKPDSIGVEMDSAGWVNVEELLLKMNAAKRSIDRAVLEEIVTGDKKGRYSFSDDGKRIRANQGHSVEVDLRLDKRTPPSELYHGTIWKAVDSIMERGLEKMQRHHVHLSADRSTASSVGARRGSPVVLVVHAGKMHEDGHEFYLSDNGVWLTGHVPAEYIEIGATEK